MANITIYKVEQYNSAYFKIFSGVGRTSCTGKTALLGSVSGTDILRGGKILCLLSFKKVSAYLNKRVPRRSPHSLRHLLR